MGNTQSGQINELVTTWLRTINAGLTVGGGEGDEKLASYVSGPVFEQKKKIIDSVVNILRQLGVKSLPTDPSSIPAEELIVTLKDVVPNPHKKNSKGQKTTWSNNLESQKGLLERLANEINRLKPGLVNVSPNSDLKVLAREIAEGLYAFVRELSNISEIPQLKKDVARILSNIDRLDKWLSQIYVTMMEKVNKDKEGSASAQTGILQQHYKIVKDEIERQKTMLNSLLDKELKPAEEELEKFLKGQDEFKSMIDKMEVNPGEEGSGNRWAYVLNLYASPAEAAHIVAKNLEKIGVSLKNFKETRGKFGSLLSEINKKLMEHLKNDSNIEEYAKAAEEIEKHKLSFVDPKFMEALERQYSKSGSAENKVTGGLKLDKRVEKRQNLKKQLLRAFNHEIASLFSKVLKAAEAFGEQVGAGIIPLSDNVEKFAKALDVLPDIQQKYVYYALSGYNDDIESRQERERFISTVKLVVATINDLLKDKEYSKVEWLRDMKSGFERMSEIIELFASRFQDGFGIITPKIGTDEKKEGGLTAEQIKSGLNKVNQAVKTGLDTTKQFAEAAGQLAQTVGQTAESLKNIKVGQGEHDEHDVKTDNISTADGISGGAPDISDMPEITKIAYTFTRIKEIVMYYLRVAQMKHSLKKAAGEVKAYGEDYTKVMGDAVAGQIDEIIRLQKADYKNEANHPLNAAFRAAGTDAEKKQVEESNKQYVKMLQAKINMYKVAQAIDLYMKEFTHAIDANIDEVKSLMHALNTTENIARWYTEKHGDLLCEVFDSMPAGNNGGVTQFNDLNAVYDNVANAQKLHYYQRVAAFCGVGYLGNRDDVHKILGLSGAIPGNVTTLRTDLKVNAVNQDLNAGQTLPGNPFLSMPISEIDQANSKRSLESIQKLLEKSLGIMALKNIIAMFINIGDKFGGQEIQKKIFMSPYQVYKELLNYITVSAVSLKRLNVPLPDGIDISGGRIAIGATSVEKSTDLNVVFNAIGEAKVLHNNMFESTDKLFTMCVKSIVAKILVTVGVFNMLHRPVDHNSLGFKSSLRTILGGAVSDTPKVMDGALSLYIRIPLLVEFYRHIFDFDNLGPNPEINEINMLPEMDGRFGALINTIFVKSKNVKQGEYSATEMKYIVEEINKCYLHYKDRKNPEMEMIDDLIAEVNKRYGIIKAEERKRYKNELKNKYTGKYKQGDEVIDFELEGLDEDDLQRGMAPSDSYQTTGLSGVTSRPDHKWSLDLDINIGYINKLRRRIDDMFNEAKKEIKPDNDGEKESLENLQNRISYNTMIKSRAEELKYAKTDKERFDVVQSAISSLGLFSVDSLERNLIAFHELVVARINTLAALCDHLVAFKGQIHTLYSAVTSLKSWVKNPEQLLNGGSVNFKEDALNTALLPFCHFNGIVRRATNGTLNPIAAANIVCAGNVQGNDINDITYTILNNLLVTASGNTDLAKQHKEVLARFTLDQERMMKQFFEALFGHAQTLDGMVTMSSEVSKTGEDQCFIAIRVDHSKLIDVVTTLFSQVKQILEKMRGLVPKDIIDRYEKRTDDGKYNTVYNLEKYLIDEVIRGRYVNPANESYDEDLGYVNTKIKEIVDFFTKRWDADAMGKGPNVIQPANVRSKFHEFRTSLLDIVLYSNAAYYATYGDYKEPFKTILTSRGPAGAGIVNAGVLDNVPTGTTVMGSTSMDLDKGISLKLPDNSIVLNFNRLLYLYLLKMYDGSLNKIYGTTINEFVNGSLSTEILGTNRFDDGAALPAPDAVNTVLFKSLGLLLKVMALQKHVREDKKQYFETNLADVPNFVKERMRSQLPVFIKLFESLSSRCDFAHRFSRGLSAAQNTDAATPFPRGVAEAHLLKLIDSVKQGCQNLIQCAKATLVELHDDPKFDELSQGFIQNYTSEHHMSPFMPTSSLQIYLKPYDITDETTLFALPFTDMGSNEFKVGYGVRGLFSADSYKLDMVPGLKEIAKAHNQSSDAKHHVDDKLLLESFQNHMQVMRYLVDAYKYRSILGLRDTANTGYYAVRTQEDSFPLTLINDLLDKLDEDKRTFQLKNATRLSDVVALTESGDQREQKRLIIHTLRNDKDCPHPKSRNTMIIFNIIDLNRVPINLHALMREIPLINLINYSYTFDKMVEKVLHVQAAELDNLPATLDLDSIQGQNDTVQEPGRRLLTIMLENPYVDMNWDVYKYHFATIMRGDLGIDGFARPKYLSDEVYNKALFGEIYPGGVYREEGGPGVGHGHLRGKREVIADNLVAIIPDIVNKSFRSVAARFIDVILKGVGRQNNGWNIFNTVSNDIIDKVCSNIGDITANQFLDESGNPKTATINYTDVYNAIKNKATESYGTTVPPDRMVRLVIASMVLGHLMTHPDVKTNLIDSIKLTTAGNRFATALNKTIGGLIQNLTRALLPNMYLIGGTDFNTIVSPAGWPQIFNNPPVISAPQVAAHFATMINNPTVPINIGPFMWHNNTAPVVSAAGLLFPTVTAAADNLIKRAFGNSPFERRSNVDDIESALPDYFPDALHFLDKNDKGQTEIKKVPLNDQATKRLLQQIGKLRFDTKFVRNIIWLVMLQRVLRLKLHHDLEFYDSRIVSKLALTVPQVTESFGNAMARKPTKTGVMQQDQ